MRRVWRLLAGLLLTVGVTLWLAPWAPDTCQPLDRLTGQSGCVGTIEVANVSPLLRSTLVATGSDGLVSLLGWQLDDQGNRLAPTLIRLDPRTGREAGRFTLAMGEGLDHAVFSADGQKALLTCTTPRPCGADGAAASIISTVDGRQLGVAHPEDAFPRIFPGDPLPPAGFSPFAMLASQGKVVVDQDPAGNITLTQRDAAGDTGRTVRLATRQDRLDSYAPRFTISPDQRHIAMVSTAYSHPSVGDRFWVWNADGSERMARAGSPGYRIAANAAWSQDGQTLFILRRQGLSVLIDTFVIP